MSATARRRRGRVLDRLGRHDDARALEDDGWQEQKQAGEKEKRAAEPRALEEQFSAAATIRIADGNPTHAAGHAVCWPTGSCTMRCPSHRCTW